MKLTKISTGVAAGLLTASLAVAPQAFAQSEANDELTAADDQSSLSSDGGKDGEGSSNGKDGEGSSLDDKQKKIIGGVFGGLAGLALLAGIVNFLQSQGGKLPF